MELRLKLIFLALLFNTVINKKHHLTRKLKLLIKQKNKLANKFRKLSPTIVKKLIDKIGVDSESTYDYGSVFGGVTNIRMAREDPFLVVNTYPVNQYTWAHPKPQINMPVMNLLII